MGILAIAAAFFGAITIIVLIPVLIMGLEEIKSEKEIAIAKINAKQRK